MHFTVSESPHGERTARSDLPTDLRLAPVTAPPHVPEPHGFAGIGPGILQLLQVYDLAVVLVCYLLVASVLGGGAAGGVPAALAVGDVLGALVAAALWSALAVGLGEYDSQRRRRDVHVEAVLLLGSVGAALMPATLGATVAASPPLVWLTLTAAAVGAMFAARGLVRWTFTAARAHRHVVIVGTGPRALGLLRNPISDPRAGFRVVGFIDSECQTDSAWVREHMLGDLAALEATLIRNVVDEVLIALPVKSCYAEIQQVIETCEQIGVEVTYPADIFRSSLAVPRFTAAHPVSRVAMKMVQDDSRRHLKRALDIGVSAAGLVLLSPLLLLVALAIRATSEGPVFFSQKRYGYNRRRFAMYKFRTMIADAERRQDELETMNEAAGPLFKIQDDPRVTAVGRFLRRTSLDELPQLVNVLRGEMSLVGPRPLPLRDVNRFPEAWLMRRFSVLPGITGLWQVGGRSTLGFDDWIRMDLRYIDRWSLWLDLKILLRTIPAVIRGTGAT